MRKLSATMQYITPRKEFVAENRGQSTNQIPPCPKSLEVKANDLLDESERVLKFDAFVNENLNKKNKGQHKWIEQVRK